MAVLFDAKSTSIAHTTVSGTTLTDNSLTIGTGTLLVAAIASHNASVTITSITWNGTALTPIPGTPFDDGANNIVGLYYLLNPVLGNHSLVATFSSAVPEIYLAGISFNGANLIGGATTFPSVVTGSGSGVTSGSLAVSTGSNDASVSVYESHFPASTLTGTTIYNSSGAGNAIESAASYSVPGATPMVAAFAAPSAWGGIAAEIAAAGGGSILWSQTCM
jgi:hypothetical protein